MSLVLFARVVIGLIFSAMLGWVVIDRQHNEAGEDWIGRASEVQRYLPYVSGGLLPLFLVAMAGASMLLDGLLDTAERMVSMCFSIFLHISIYFLILASVLPFLRKHISARACAMLWMVPNYLYLVYQGTMQIPEPLLVVHVPGTRLMWMLFFVWLAGFFAVLLWKIISHLVFRRQLLKDTVAVTDSEVNEIWNSEIERAGIRKPKCGLVVSPKAATPLSIGLFRRTTCVVLPNRQYPPDALALIFRHEIIHIGREDAWTKFFLVFCTALCWFNPLMWMATKKSTEDLELSCDETVLLDADHAVRHQYAELILDTAGDPRGFTTCLSATASSLRYRLANIMKPVRRRSGAVAVGLVFFLLITSFGYVGLTYGEYTGAEVVYPLENSGQYTLYGNIWTDGDSFECTDPSALQNYMKGLTMERFTGSYSFEDSEKQFSFTYETPQGFLGVTLSDHALELTPLYEAEDGAAYYIPEGVDWAYLDTIIELR